MMYCRYCGKQLRENEVCSCRMGLPVEPEWHSASEAQSASAQQVPQNQTAQQDTQSQTAEQVRQAAAKVQRNLAHGARVAADAVQSSDTVQGSKNLLLRLMSNPITGLREAYRSGKRAAQYCLGGLYLLLWLLLGITAFTKISGSLGVAIIISVVLLIAAAVVQLVYCIWFNLFSDKSQGFSGVCAAMGAGLWPETIGMLLLLILLLLFGASASVPVLVVLFLTMTLDLLSHYTVAIAVCGEKKGFYVCLSALVIVNLLLLLLVLAIVSSMYGSVDNYLNALLYSALY